MQEKICTHCNELKDINEFYKHKKGLYGTYSKCKICKKTLYKNIQKQYYIDNKDIIKEKQKVYNQTENRKELNRIYKSKRKCSIRNSNDSTITLGEIKNLLIKQKGKCNYCGININNREDRHLDHIKPISKGGIHSINNVQWLCCKCNLSKGNALDD